jgi:aspartyl-tRNA(Asn)/glutamyl-tRNA(Gln) amidotransferase subunit C
MALQAGMLAFGMPAGFSRDQIEAIAALAHLELDAAEADLFARQLGDILAYAEIVQQIDTTGIPPTASVSHSAADRLDQIVPGLDRHEALGGAPDAALEAGFFRVPRIIG